MSRRVLLLLLLVAAALLLGARQRAVRPAPAPVPTFSNEVVRIFQSHCQSCHRRGDIAPFSLTTYREAAPWAQAIKFMTATRRMPPWKPAAGCGEFAGERVLTQQEIETIGRWVDAGAPEGDRSHLPAPLDFGGGWTLGEPDLVLSYPQAYVPPASDDIYRCFPIPTNITEERWVSGIDVHPGDRGRVHHVIAFIDTTGDSATLDAADPEPGYTCFGGPGFELSADATLGGWAPGYRAFKLPEDVGLRLPANSRVVLQVHYASHHGQPQADRTELGVYFAARQPRQLLRVIPVANTTFEIPAEHANYRVGAGIPLIPFPIHLWVIAPHMHLLGRSMLVQTTNVAGETRCLVNIEDWDFNWQAMYRYREPIPIPAFSNITLTAYYDNSSGNHRNPNNPPQPVRWGEATTDEMCIAFLGVTIDGEDLPNGVLADDSALRSR
ncbi:MAG TPA: ascorbate-dependent monooxygenase [Thermoanaerobaculia bacterium]|nr:ascorbate-dependent monooxygenase [Thermoanaerobaculia bacterium]